MEKQGKRGVAGSFDSVMGRVRRFIGDTVAELGRCTWPSKPELMESTLLVVVAMAILAGFVAGVDWVAQWVIELVTVGRV